MGGAEEEAEGDPLVSDNLSQTLLRHKNEVTKIKVICVKRRFGIITCPASRSSDRLPEPMMSKVNNAEAYP